LDARGVRAGGIGRTKVGVQVALLAVGGSGAGTGAAEAIQFVCRSAQCVGARLRGIFAS